MENLIQRITNLKTPYYTSECSMVINGYTIFKHWHPKEIYVIDPENKLNAKVIGTIDNPQAIIDALRTLDQDFFK